MAKDGVTPALKTHQQFPVALKAEMKVLKCLQDL